jgi:hypothetical protein
LSLSAQRHRCGVFELDNQRLRMSNFEQLLFSELKLF